MKIFSIHAAFWGGFASIAARLRRAMTSFLPNFINKTTLVENVLPRIINLITLFFAKLGNEVTKMLTFILATEVVLFLKLGVNKVFP
jgi:hypothetical protein